MLNRTQLSAPRISAVRAEGESARIAHNTVPSAASAERARVRTTTRPIATPKLSPRIRSAAPYESMPVVPDRPLRRSALDLAELHNIRNRMQVRLGVTATQGLLRAVQVGALLGLVATTVITIASPWIHIFGLGAAIFTGILVGSIIIGLISQNVARARYFRAVTKQPEFEDDMRQVAETRLLLSERSPKERTGEQNAQLFLAKRIEQEVAWGVREQLSQVLRGFFGENELILTSKLMR